ncbi:DUF4864 domain-containing protein [Kaistia dalseonensis]|uniref:DUF4864 domain-containing protein n=1 Tax=Kaistia dalseonensis TaxID=410840 RepID=A0ABU0H281_9HYPH|nr:DUF4864 domain-containing protein [Kaistia dalseonensis]MCX5493832.1 DUF4864 domain-containing protein [Kaistia dalseonensis]MDQ0436397.1 hypothetical protein [Kaistia dalseonensis]
MHIVRSAILILFALSAAPAFAEPSGADKQAMHDVVQSQLNAFQRDDGVTAYAFAAPGIQTIFRTPEAFMNMVRQAYPQVYRPRSVTYGAVIERPEGITQDIFLTGPDGQNWVARYRFEKQPDGSWKISGVAIVKDTAPTI